MQGGGLVKLKRAVKMVKNNATREDKDEFLREAETMIILKHANLVKIIGIVLNPITLCNSLYPCKACVPPVSIRICR